MSYVALYRKYRPKTFDEVVGQDIVVQILKTSVINNTFTHAYLFAGSRGTGKTSIAKIFAKTINCNSPIDGVMCEKCDNCIKLQKNDIDIIEIDAASNNGVEEIREIRSKVKLMPTIGKYKVYIIDEVHMLSVGAFNALLKTLEEPPKHVIFILATTEIQKIPLTILSRCQRFDFKKINEKSLENRLKEICEKENRLLKDDIIKTIVKLGDGSCRDAINLLDQVLSLNDDNITEEDIYNISGVVSETILFNIMKNIYNKKLPELLSEINKLFDEGKNLTSIVDGLILLVRDITINQTISNYFSDERKVKLDEFNFELEYLKKMLDILNELNEKLSKSLNQKNLLEIYLIYLTNIGNNNVNKQVEVCNQVECKNVETKEVLDQYNDNILHDNNELKKIRINNILVKADKNLLIKNLTFFDRFNDFISNKVYNGVATLLLESKLIVASQEHLMFSFVDDSLVNAFYLNMNLITDLVNQIFENQYKLIAVSEAEWKIIREKFISDKKNNVVLKYIQEPNENRDGHTETNKVEDMAVDVFGEELVEIK